MDQYKRNLETLEKRFFIDKFLYSKPALKNKKHFCSLEKKVSFEEKKELEKTKKKEIDIICVHGLDLINFVIKNVFEENIKFIFFENDISIMDGFLQQEYCQEILENRQIDICFFDDNKSLEEQLKKTFWKHIFLKADVFISSNRDNRDNFFDIFQEIYLGVHSTMSLYSDCAYRRLDNLFGKLFLNPSFYLLEGLKNKYKNIPAIVCGAGPSLDENMSIISEMQNRALIFAGGSAMNVFSSHGIRPHFCGSCDPSDTYDRFKRNDLAEVPFFYRNSTFKDNFNLVHAPKIYLMGGNDYPAEDYLQKELQLPINNLNFGWTIGTSLIQIAAFLGCNPIILVGMDLSLTDSKIYSKSVAYQKGEKHSLLETKESVLSQADWLLSASWISDFAVENPQLKLFNTSKKGIEIKGVSKVDLSSDFNFPYRDLNSLSHLILQNEREEKIGFDRYKEVILKWEESLVSCLRGCEEGLSSLEKQFHLQRFVGVENSLDIKEKAYENLLSPLWDVWKYSFLREIEKEDKSLSVDFALKINKLLFLKNVILNHRQIATKYLG